MYEYTNISVEDTVKIFTDKIFVILTASSKEKEAIINVLEPVNRYDKLIKISIDGNECIIGSMSKYICVISKSKNQGSIRENTCMQIISSISKYFDISLVIGFGICFGIKNINKGDIILSSEVYLYEPEDVSVESKKSLSRKPVTNIILKDLLKIISQQYENTVYGAMASGEKKINDPILLEKIKKYFPVAIAGDMESAGISIACKAKRINWCMVKAVSDFASGDNSTEPGFGKAEAYGAAKILKNIFSNEKFINQFPTIEADFFDKMQSIEMAYIIPYHSLNLEDLIKFEMPRAQYDIKINKNSTEKIHYEYCIMSFQESNDIGFALFGNNISIKNTVEHLFTQNLPSQHLNIFTPRVKSKKGSNDFRVSQIEKAVNEYCGHKHSLKIRCYFIEDYIWNKSKPNINSSFNKGNQILTTKYFIDQPIFDSSGSSCNIENNVVEKISNMLMGDADVSQPIIAITGEAGIGKSTLCKEISNRINRSDKNIKSIYLSNEKYSWPKPESKILTVYDLYKYFVSKIDIDNNDDDINYLSLSLRCGNIVLVIDGIDEIASALGSVFDIDSFMESISDIHKTFFQCKILFAARDFYNDTLKKYQSICIFSLKGFTADLAKRFFSKKLEKNADELKNSAMMLLKTISDNGPWNPLYADISSEIVLRTHEKIQHVDVKSKYLDLSCGIDSLIVDLLNRENRKQNLSASIDDLIDYLFTICIDYDGSISYGLLEEAIRIIFLSQIDSEQDIITRFMKSPFLLIDGDIFKFKYSHINDILRARFLTYAIKNASIQDTARLIKILCDISRGNIDIIREMQREKIFNSQDHIKTAHMIYDKIKLTISLESKEKIESRIALSGLIKLSLQSPSVNEKEERTKILEEICGNPAEYFTVYGDIPPIDFSNFSIIHGQLFDCEDIFKSIFPNRICLMDTDISLDDNTSAKIPEYILDADCRCIKGAAYAVDSYRASTDNFLKNINKDIESIFKAFYRGSRFEKLSRNRISMGIPRLISSFSIEKLTDKLTTTGIIVKDNDDLFSIKIEFQNDVQSFIINGNMPSSLHKALVSIYKR